IDDLPVAGRQPTAAEPAPVPTSVPTSANPEPPRERRPGMGPEYQARDLEWRETNLAGADNKEPVVDPDGDDDEARDE
ncbi:MAG: hypothetical protein WBQ18_08020, partial [Solirubrobacteraceae bacterium]